jgi:sporulation protein YlmC with PRC-barrel domain
MLRRAHSLLGLRIHAEDGDLGRVDDFYFDDLEWKIRYMIVRTGSWFSEKRVMLSPSSIIEVMWEEPSLYVNLTKAQIQESPDLDLQKPVTREQEMELARHYRWPTYWAGGPAGAVGSSASTLDLAATAVPGMGVAPIGLPAGQPAGGVTDHIANDISSTGISDEASVGRDTATSPEGRVETELQRAAQATGLHHYQHGVTELTGHHLAATDGEIGRVEDFFIDEDNWQIQYLLVDTGGWLSERKVLISPRWITEISWEDKQVRAKMTRAQIENSPEYDPHQSPDRHYEGRLHEHYGERPYWS